MQRSCNAEWGRGARVRRVWPAAATLATFIAATSLGRTLESESVPFDTYRQYDAGENSTGVVAIDVDGDGDLDLAVSNRVSNDVSILINLGDATFDGPVSCPVGLQPRYVVGADFDGDGDADLATTDKVGNSVTLLQNLGDGSFIPLDQLAVSQPDWLIAADLDDDGDQDLLVSEFTSPHCLTLLVNDGAMIFTTAESWVVPAGPRGGDVADLSGGGFRDVVVTAIVDDVVTVLFNDGDGFFREAIDLPAGEQPRYAAAADFDADGDVDLAVINKAGDDLWLYWNHGDGSFSAPPLDRYPTNSMPHAIDSADFDLDGDIDLAISHVNVEYFVRLMLNDGFGRFTPQLLTSPDGGAHVIAVDLQSDGDHDLVTANTNNGSVNVFLNQTREPGGGLELALAETGEAATAPGPVFDVELRMRDLGGQEAIRFETSLRFRPHRVTFLHGAYTSEPFGLPLITPIVAMDDRIDLSAGLDPSTGQPPSSDDAVLAVLTFESTGPSCGFELEFCLNEGPSRLIQPDGTAIVPLALHILPGCPGDVTGDCVVDFADLLEVLAYWGPCPGCRADLDDSGTVALGDLLQILAAWGSCGQ
ncbi:MAG: hypothetical protein HKN62_12715 [Phycisphaerales bacterium]|nr:hypothetical protein [Phycisphaerales bacterium]